MVPLTSFFLSILTTGICLVLLVIFALRAKQIVPLDNAHRRDRSQYQKLHISWVKRFCFMTTVSVILIIFAVKENGGRWGPEWLSGTHMGLVKIGTGLLFLTLIFNGKKNRKIHTKIVYVFLFFFILMLISGLWLLFKHPLLFGT